MAEGVDGEADVLVVLLVGGRADDEDDLAFDVAAKAPREFGQGAPGDLLVHLGHLAADGRLAVRGDRRQRGEVSPIRRGLSKAMTVTSERSTFSIASERFGRKPSKRQRSVGRPEATRATGTTEGPGRTVTSRARSIAAPDQAEAGVGDRRHAGVGDQGDPGAALDLLGELGRARGFVALVVRDQPRRRPDPELVEQAAGPAGVLAGDVVGGDERVAGPRCEVVEVSDRGRADDQLARHQPPCPLELDPGHRGGADHARVGAELARRRPGSRSSAAGRALAARWRAGSSSRSPAAITPPPITKTSGSKMLAKLASATPSREPTRSKTADRGRVARQGGLGDRLPVDLLAVGEHPTERRAGLTLGGVATLAPDRGPGGVGLDAAVAGAVALAGQAVHLDHDVAELGAGTGRAAVDLAVEDQAAADSGPDRQHHRVVGAAGGAVEVLGEGGDVGVVVDEDRQPGPFADQLADRQVVDREVDRGDRNTTVVVDRRRDPEPAATTPGRASWASSISRTSSSISSSSVWPVERSLALEGDLISGVEDAVAIFVPPRSTPIASGSLIDFERGWDTDDRRHRHDFYPFHARERRAAALGDSRLQGLQVAQRLFFAI